MKEQPLIYLVEDEDELRRSIDFTLRRNGFQVKAFKEPHLALKELADPEKTSPVMLLITDVRMPKMDGVELVNALRKSGHTLPILVITGQANRTERAKLLELGVLRILDKPFSLSELVAEIKTILDQKR